ncbi:MAG: hypothetical protein HQK51_16275 [Oligoflexia bacterium]|nr:hypothetical protein [Oligoflexia bacterium]
MISSSLKRKIILNNLEKRMDTLTKVLFYISDSDTAALNLVKKALTLYEQNGHFIDNSNITNLISEAQGQLNEVSYLLNKELSNNLSHSLEETEKELENIIERLDLYQKIKLKHGSNINDVLNFKKTIEEELAQFENIEDQIIELSGKITSHENSLINLANDLHIKRQQTSLKLSKILTSEIRLLKMDEATINIQIEKIQNQT